MANPEETQELSISDVLNDSYDKIEAGATGPALETEDLTAGAAAADPVIDTPTDDLNAATGQPAEKPADTATNDQPATKDDAKGELPADQNDAGDPAAQQEQDPEDAAPSSWKREVAEKWTELPKEVKDEIQRRETDYHKGIEQYKQYAGIGRDIERVITPHLQTIQQLGIHPMEAIDTLLKADQKLRFGSPEEKAQYFGQLAQEYGIDIGKVQPPAPVDPAVMQLRQQNQQLQQFQRSVMEQQQQQVLAEIEAFKANPQNTHFESVKDDMAVLLQSGKATSLQDAYDKAVWMRPDIRKSLVEQQRTEAEQKTAAQLRNKRAQSAAVGIKGSASSKGGSLNPDASLRDTLNAALAGDL